MTPREQLLHDVVHRDRSRMFPLSHYPVRHSWSFSSRYAHEKGDAWIEAEIVRQHAIALSLAEQVGITQPEVRTLFDLDVACNFTDYPMYLCGPGAPRIEGWRDVFKHVWHLDNPICKHTVIVRDREVEAMMDAERKVAL